MADNAVFERIKGYLGDNYTKSDDELIAMYVAAAEYLDVAKKAIDEDGLVLFHTNAAGATNIQKHPLSIEITKILHVMNNLLKSLGLTAAQRKKEQEPFNDGFDEF